MENTTGADQSPALKERLKSRKFLISQQVIFVSVAVPILFNHLGIGESVTLAVIGIIGGMGAAYGVVNTLEKKWNT